MKTPSVKICEKQVLSNKSAQKTVIKVPEGQLQHSLLLRSQVFQSF